MPVQYLHYNFNQLPTDFVFGVGEPVQSDVLILDLAWTVSSCLVKLQYVDGILSLKHVKCNMTTCATVLL